jgi:hypothetical protein
MAADPTRAAPRRALRALAFVLTLQAAAASAVGGGPGAPVEKPTSGASPAAAAKGPGDGPGWYDGRTWRPLTLEPSLRAESGAAVGKTVVLRRVAGPVKEGDPGAVVLRDDSGRARVLPGGVLVVLARPLDDEAARTLLARHGLPGARRIADGLWRADTPAGLASLEVANRLATSGDFGSAQPDWWVERVRK